MKKESWKVFVACAIGAGIGSLVSLEISRWFWWLGLIVGGLTGYLSYEFKRVLHAIPAAYRAARGWKAPPNYWSTIWWVSATAFSGSLLIMTGMVCPAFFSNKPTERTMALWLIICFSLFMAILFGIIVAVANRN